MIRVFLGVPESYGNSPGSIWALLGLSGIEARKGKVEGAPPLAQSELGAPLPSHSLPFLLSYSYYLEGGILVPVGVGLPKACHSRWPALPLLHSFIYGGGGTP